MTQFEQTYYTVVPNSLHRLASVSEKLLEAATERNKQLTRIADALEARNFKDGLPASQHVVDEIVAKGPSA